MKTITTLFLAVLLCVSMFASESTATLSTVLVQFREKAEKSRINMSVPDKRKGVEMPVNLTRYTLLEQMGDSKGKTHLASWIAAVRDPAIATKPLTELRKAVAALPPSAETKTFLARALDPSIAAIATYKANDAEITRTQVEALAQLHMALSQAK